MCTPENSSFPNLFRPAPLNVPNPSWMRGEGESKIDDLDGLLTDVAGLPLAFTPVFSEPPSDSPSPSPALEGLPTPSLDFSVPPPVYQSAWAPDGQNLALFPLGFRADRVGQGVLNPSKDSWDSFRDFPQELLDRREESASHLIPPVIPKTFMRDFLLFIRSGKISPAETGFYANRINNLLIALSKRTKEPIESADEVALWAIEKISQRSRHDQARRFLKLMLDLKWVKADSQGLSQVATRVFKEVSFQDKTALEKMNDFNLLSFCFEAVPEQATEMWGKLLANLWRKDRSAAIGFLPQGLAFIKKNGTQNQQLRILWNLTEELKKAPGEFSRELLYKHVVGLARSSNGSKAMSCLLLEFQKLSAESPRGSLLNRQLECLVLGCMPNKDDLPDTYGATWVAILSQIKEGDLTKRKKEKLREWLKPVVTAYADDKTVSSSLHRVCLSLGLLDFRNPKLSPRNSLTFDELFKESPLKAYQFVKQLPGLHAIEGAEKRIKNLGLAMVELKQLDVVNWCVQSLSEIKVHSAPLYQAIFRAYLTDTHKLEDARKLLFAPEVHEAMTDEVWEQNLYDLASLLAKKESEVLAAKLIMDKVEGFLLAEKQPLSKWSSLVNTIVESLLEKGRFSLAVDLIDHCKEPPSFDGKALRQKLIKKAIKRQKLDFAWDLAKANPGDPELLEAVIDASEENGHPEILSCFRDYKVDVGEEKTEVRKEDKVFQKLTNALLNYAKSKSARKNAKLLDKISDLVWDRMFEIFPGKELEMPFADRLQRMNALTSCFLCSTNAARQKWALSSLTVFVLAHIGKDEVGKASQRSLEKLLWVLIEKNINSCQKEKDPKEIESYHNFIGQLFLKLDSKKRQGQSALDHARRWLEVGVEQRQLLAFTGALPFFRENISLLKGKEFGVLCRAFEAGIEGRLEGLDPDVYFYWLKIMMFEIAKNRGDERAQGFIIKISRSLIQRKAVIGSEPYIHHRDFYNLVLSRLIRSEIPADDLIELIRDFLQVLITRYTECLKARNLNEGSEAHLMALNLFSSSVAEEIYLDKDSVFRSSYRMVTSEEFSEKEIPGLGSESRHEERRLDCKGFSVHMLKFKERCLELLESPRALLNDITYPFRDLMSRSHYSSGKKDHLLKLWQGVAHSLPSGSEGNKHALQELHYLTYLRLHHDSSYECNMDPLLESLKGLSGNGEFTLNPNEDEKTTRLKKSLFLQGIHVMLMGKYTHLNGSTQALWENAVDRFIDYKEGFEKFPKYMLPAAEGLVIGYCLSRRSISKEMTGRLRKFVGGLKKEGCYLIEKMYFRHALALSMPAEGFTLSPEQQRAEVNRLVLDIFKQSGETSSGERICCGRIISLLETAVRWGVYRRKDPMLKHLLESSVLVLLAKEKSRPQGERDADFIIDTNERVQGVCRLLGIDLKEEAKEEKG